MLAKVRKPSFTSRQLTPQISNLAECANIVLRTSDPKRRPRKPLEEQVDVSVDEAFTLATFAGVASSSMNAYSASREVRLRSKFRKYLTIA